MNERGPKNPPSAEDAWTTLRALQECVVRSLARGDNYGLLLSASRDAEALLARHAADSATVREQNGQVEHPPRLPWAA